MMRWWIVAALLWGFAEATFFFIVPDLLLTASVIAFGFVRAFRLAIFAAIGAVIGGLLMHWWGAHDITAALGLLRSIPLIADDLLARVAAEMNAAHWPMNLSLGALTGAPFKIYAAEAGNLGIHPAVFAVVGFGARMLRFGFAIALTALGVSLASRLGLGRLVPVGLALVWITIYGIYGFVRLSA